MSIGGNVSSEGLTSLSSTGSSGVNATDTRGGIRYEINGITAHSIQPKHPYLAAPLMKLPLLLCLLLIALHARAQAPAAPPAILDSGRDCSIRGLSIPQTGVIWASGSKGSVARSTDGGRSWIWTTVPGYETTDFRDIHAFDSLQALIMGIGNPARILKTGDGGRTWTPVFSKEAPGMFLDAMDFRGREGICIGDPIGTGAGPAAFYIIRSHDGGDTWQEEAPGKVPPAAAGEAVFSGSGSNISLLGRGRYAFISGGRASNLYLVGRGRRPARINPLPIRKGTESAGAFSLAARGRKRFYCVGGDYRNPEAADSNMLWTANRGRRWNTPAETPPGGYRSCIRVINGETLLACGPTGIDICRNPRRWQRISGEGFHVCAVSPDRAVVFFAGAKGRIAMLRLKDIMPPASGR